MTARAGNLPNGKKTYLNHNGKPLAGAKVTYYRPDTTELATVFLDDMLLVAATNPVILDAAGACTIFAVGEFREYVEDVDGTLISDAVVVAGTPLKVAEAMRPVLEAATPAAAEALLEAAVGPMTHLEIKPGDETINVAPTGNAPNTRASLNVQGTTLHPGEREFLASIGLESNVGVGTALDPHGAHKVALYTGIVGKTGTGSIWSFNPLLTMEANSGSYNAQCVEVDFNNFNANRGASGALGTDFAAPVAVGLSISGAGSFSSTCGLEIVSTDDQGAKPPQWNRGITTVGVMGICAYQDWTKAPIGINLDGNYQVAAINLAAVFGNPGAQCDTALFLRAGHRITWQSPDQLHVISDFLDSAGNRYVGASSDPAQRPGIILGGTTIPQIDGGFELGASTNRWTSVWSQNLRLSNQGAITWQNNPANAGGINDLIFDYVDNTNNRVVGSHAQIVYMGATTAPQTPNFDLGTNLNPWGQVYSSSGIVTPSDPALKTNTKHLEGALDVVNQINPISFKWQDGRDDRVHFGFNADEVRDAAPVAYREIDGHKFVAKDDLLAVAWQAIRELQDEVKRLRNA